MRLSVDLEGRYIGFSPISIRMGGGGGDYDHHITMYLPPAPFPTSLLFSLTRRSKFLVSTYLLSTTSTGRKNFLTVIREDFYGKLLPRSQEDTLGVTLTTDHSFLI